MKRAREFYETALYQIDQGFYALAAFSLEQYLQLTLKARLLQSGVDHPRTHSIRRLLELVGEVNPTKQAAIKELLDTYTLELALLEDIYITSRYSPREFKRAEVDRPRRLVERVVAHV